MVKILPTYSSSTSQMRRTPFPVITVALYLGALSLTAVGASDSVSISEKLIAERRPEVETFITNSRASVIEEHFPNAFGGQCREGGRRRNPILQPLKAVMATLTTTMVIAFLVMQCFKATLEHHRAAELFRRLSEAQELEDGPDCGVTSILEAMSATCESSTISYPSCWQLRITVLSYAQLTHWR
ncbi:hypothetical protein Efla_006029 [Eimeria flavescens]